MSQYAKPASDDIVAKTAQALKANGLEVFIVANGAEAKKKALELIPEKSEVFTATSVTVDSIGLSAELNDSGRFDSVKTKLNKMDRNTQAREMRKLGAGPDYAVGSAHAVTQDGTVVIASMSGSQLPAYVYGAGTVVWIIGTQKIVKDGQEAMDRIHTHILPLESVRVRKAYGLPDTFSSFPAKVVFYNREVAAGRVKVILVKEALGF
jgi:hypothetical protein